MSVGVFLLIGLIGLILVFSSFILDHDHGDFDHDMHLDHDAGDHDTTHDGTHEHNSSILRYLSIRIIAAFCVGFGGFGAIMALSGLSIFLAFLAASFGGMVSGYIVRQFMDLLLRNQGSSAPSARQLRGRTAQVIEDLVNTSIGEIRIILDNGIPVSKRARAYLGKSIPKGIEVVVLETLEDGTVVVARFDELTESLGTANIVSEEIQRERRTETQ